MSGKEMKEKIRSALSDVPLMGKTKKPSLKKTVSDIFSRNANEEHAKKILPLFQITSLRESIKPGKRKVLINKLKNFAPILREKGKIWAKAFIKNLGFTEELTSMWGLDIGTGYIKLLRISREKDKPVVTNFFCEFIPPQFHSLSPKRDKYLKEFLRKFVLEHKIEGEFVTCSITSPSLIIRAIKLPRMTEDEIPKAVKRRLAQQHAVDLNKEVLRFNILGEKEDRGTKQIEILTVSIPKEIVISHFDLVKQSGLIPVAIEPECFPLTFCFLENYKGNRTLPASNSDKVIVILNIGARYTTFNLIINRALNFSRKISFGSNDIFAALTANMGISLEAAEEKLTKFGIPRVYRRSSDLQGDKDISYSEETQVFKAIQPSLEKLVTEFHSTFKFYSYQVTHSVIQKIDKALITGGACKIKNLNEFLNVHLETPVEIFDPIANIEIAKEIDKNSIEQFSSQLDIAIGLALRKTV